MTLRFASYTVTSVLKASGFCDPFAPYEPAALRLPGSQCNSRNKVKTPEDSGVFTWLRGLDSNQRPIGYIYPKFSNGNGLYHHPP